MEVELDGVNELSRAGDFVALCKLGHPLEEAHGVLAEIGDVHRVDVQCDSCKTVFVFRNENGTSHIPGWRLVESSDPRLGEYCAAKRMRIGMAEEQRRMKFQAH